MLHIVALTGLLKENPLEALFSLTFLFFFKHQGHFHTIVVSVSGHF